MLAERADIVDRATDIVEHMLDDVVAVMPTDPKGQALVPQWEADYRTLIANRREYSDELRQGHDEPFHETAVDGIPISDKLTRFAGDNYMPIVRRAAGPRRTDRRRRRPGSGRSRRLVLDHPRRVAGGHAVVGERRRVTTLFAPTTTCRPIVGAREHDRAVAEPRPGADAHRPLGHRLARDRQGRGPRSRGSGR